MNQENYLCLCNYNGTALALADTVGPSSEAGNCREWNYWWWRRWWTWVPVDPRLLPSEHCTVGELGSGSGLRSAWPGAALCTIVHCVLFILITNRIRPGDKAYSELSLVPHLGHLIRQLTRKRGSGVTVAYHNQIREVLYIRVINMVVRVSNSFSRKIGM